MGKQSARLVYQGQDHKDIFYEGNYHDKFYYRGKLVWEKLYPEKYFAATNQFRNAMAASSIAPYDRHDTLMFNNEEACVKKQVPWYAGSNNYEIREYSDSAVFCRVGRKVNAVTKDLVHFKLIEGLTGTPKGTVGNCFVYTGDDGIIEAQILTIKDDDLNYDIINISTDFEGRVLDVIFSGNYIVALRQNNDYDNKIAYYNYITIDKDGSQKKITKQINANDATMERLYENCFSKGGEDFEVILGDSAYYNVRFGDRSWNTSDGYKYVHTTEKIVKRNLDTFNDIVVADYGEVTRYYHHCLYKSNTKCVFMGADYDSSVYPYVYRAFVASVGPEIHSVFIHRMDIKVYREDRKITVIPVAINNQEIKKDVIHLFDSRFTTSVPSETAISISSAGFPTVNKEKVQLDVMDGMLFEFSYGKSTEWYIRGYMYIDNFTFSESESNYIYILEEYENGEKIYERV